MYCAAHKKSIFPRREVARPVENRPKTIGIYLKYASMPTKMVNEPVTINGLVTLPT